MLHPILKQARGLEYIRECLCSCVLVARSHLFRYFSSFFLTAAGLRDAGQPRGFPAVYPHGS